MGVITNIADIAINEIIIVNNVCIRLRKIIISSRNKFKIINERKRKISVKTPYRFNRERYKSSSLKEKGM